MQLSKLKNLAVAAAAVALLATQAGAAEHITLRNGFEMLCNHHSNASSKVRLFLSNDESNYIEVASGDIAVVEAVPDPPQPDPVAPESSRHTARPTDRNAPLSPADLKEMLTTAGHEHNLDADLLASVVKAESGGNATAVSRTGARGLMQLMPATAADLGVADSFRPDQNVRGGSTYLDSLLMRYHDNLALALAAYNAGPAAVAKYHGIPPYRETRLYVARVIHEFNRRVLARQAQIRQIQTRQTVATALQQTKAGQ